MKKTISFILLLALLLSLGACGNDSAENANNSKNSSTGVINVKDITIDNLVGTWHSADTKQVMTVNTNDVWLFQHPINTTGSPMPPKVENNQLVIFGLGTFDIESDNGQLKIVCTATEMIAKDTTFVKCEEIVSLDEIAAHSWINPDTGATLTFANGSYTHTAGNGSSMNAETQWSFLAGDTYYMPNVDVFKIITEGDSFKLVGESLGEYITPEAAAIKAESELINMGETAKSDFFEITVKEYEFVELLGNDNTTRLFARDVSWDNAGDGKVFMIVKFDYMNLDKQEIDMVRDVCVTVNYKDGYEFASFDEEKAYLFEDDINGVFRRCSLDIGGYVMELSPLTSGSFFVAVPVAEIVSADTESAITVRFDYGDNIKGGAPVSESISFKIQ